MYYHATTAVQQQARHARMLRQHGPNHPATRWAASALAAGPARRMAPAMPRTAKALYRNYNSAMRAANRY